MDRQEAKTLIEEELRRYRVQSYANLLRLLSNVDAYEITGPSRRSYQVEVHAIWDDHPNGNIRVFGEISDGFWRSIFPLCKNFIMSPQGHLVDETSGLHST